MIESGHRLSVSRQCTLLALALTLQGAVETPDADHSAKPAVLISGSKHGMAREFARQYAQVAWRVIDTSSTLSKAVDLKAMTDEHVAGVLATLQMTKPVSVAVVAAAVPQTPVQVSAEASRLGGAKSSGGMRGMVSGR